MTERDDSEPVAAGVRRVTGFSALRRLRRLVDAENAQTAADARAVPRIALFVVVLIVLLLLSPPMRQLLGRAFG